MVTRERFVTIREDPHILAQVDKLAREQGTDRSSFYRMAVRDRIRMEADSTLEHYNKHR